MNIKTITIIGCAVCTLLTPGCADTQKSQNAPPHAQEKQQEQNGLTSTIIPSAYDFDVDADPETEQLFIIRNGNRTSASLPMPKEPVTNLDKTPESISWTYPRKQISIQIKKQDRYAEVSLTSTGAKRFEWPKVEGDSYMLPIGEGKYIPGGDGVWKSFLKDNDMSFIECFSMRFFVVNHKMGSILYIADDMFNDTVHFRTEPAIQMSFTHEFPAVNPNKTYRFRIYVTDNDPARIASIYRSYIREKGEFTPLAEKATQNPNVSKLFGEPHIYLWSSQAITEDNIHWNTLAKRIRDPLFGWIGELLLTPGLSTATQPGRSTTTIPRRIRRRSSRI
ncbi:hypothetical protein [Paenibacillus chibensis]|uniref:hypothetical protein n=1 Tax=Paenibacillus chibensis TaxID=59846 RepID=UPI000FD968F5|nr:hypothetical protein [Paenibacillus chibensis]MEC0369857.1 hypothetical protein [Paenibacillus chibensis]